MFPSIQFINHASFAVLSGTTRVLVDPWLSGTSFADSWSLVDESVDSLKVLSLGITHIVYTHEHPDHFSPSFLLSIPPGRRASICVVFQSTKDRKLVQFAQKHGFTTKEVESKRSEVLGDGIGIQIEPFDKIDSCLLFRIEANSREYTVLNTNDCEFRTRESLIRYLENMNITDGVDVLFTQFSYSNWFGNRDDPSGRKRAADVKLEQFTFQVECARPKVVVPFASFVFFSHHENFFNNDSINTPAEVSRRIGNLFPGKLRFMKPFDEAPLEAPHNPDASNAALAYWKTKYRGIELRTPKPAPVPLPVLRELCDRYVESNLKFLKRRRLVYWYNWYTMPSINVVLTDHDDLALELHPLKGILREGTRAQLSAQGSDFILLSSSALDFVMRFGWGWDSIHIGGRYEVSHRDYYSTVDRAFFVGLYRHNNVSGNDMFWRIVRAILLRTAGAIGGTRFQNLISSVFSRVISHRVARSSSQKSRA